MQILDILSVALIPSLTVIEVTGDIRIEPLSATITENESYMFTCNVTGQSGLLTFKYNQVSVCTVYMGSGDQVRSLPDVSCGPDPTIEGTYNLTIERVNRRHYSGDWFCNAGTSVSNKATLFVKYSSTVTSFVANGKAGSVRVGEEEGVTLTCHVDANPRGLITIRRRNAILSRNNDVNVTSFSVTSAQCIDTGVYACEAGNTIGTGSDFLFLQVECAPSAVNPRPKSVLVSTRGQTTLVLSVLAYPRPVFKWYHPQGYLLKIKKGTYVSESEFSTSLVVGDISSEDFGDYTVTVQNYKGIGIFTLSLQEETGLSSLLVLAIGVSVGVILLAVLAGALVTCCRRRNKVPVYDVPVKNINTDQHYQALIRDYETPIPHQVTHEIPDDQYETPIAPPVTQGVPDDEYVTPIAPPVTQGVPDDEYVTPIAPPVTKGVPDDEYVTPIAPPVTQGVPDDE